MDKITLKASANGKLNISELEHPNKMPFKGVLTYLGRLSKEPPHGAGGLRVYIPNDVGKPAIASLQGMAVNYIQGNPTGHDPKNKVGVITKAYAGETQEDGAIPVVVEGYVYAVDFPEAAASIKASQSILGFSYETAQTQLVKGEVGGVECAVVTNLGYYTGASILYRDSASYGDTSLAASKDNKEEITLDFEKMLAELKEAFKNEVATLRNEFGHKPEVVKVEEVVKEEVAKAEEAVKEEAPKVEEAVKQEAKAEEAKAEEAVKQEAVKVEEAVATEAPKVVEEVKAEETKLNASSLLAELEALKAELKSLKEETNLQASARKSVMYPTSALAKYDLDEVDDKTKLMASIDAKAKELSLEERLALKFEALDKVNK